MDGVLANFVNGFNTIAKEKYQIDMPAEWPCMYPFGEGYNITQEQFDTVMERFLNQPHAWYNLKEIMPSDVDILAELTQKSKLLAYFTTARDDTKTGSWTDSATYQSKLWLTSKGVDPAGVIGRRFDRVKLLTELGVDHHIDDNPKLFQQVTDAGIDCWLFDQSYNKHINTPKRVYSIKEFLSKIPY